MKSFKTHLEAILGNGLGERDTVLPPMPLAGDGNTIPPRVYALVYQTVDTKPRKLIKKLAIWNLRSYFSNPVTLDVGEFVDQMGACDLPAVSTGASYYTHGHYSQPAAELLETRQVLVPANTSFSRPTTHWSVFSTPTAREPNVP